MDNNGTFNLPAYNNGSPLATPNATERELGNLILKASLPNITGRTQSNRQDHHDSIAGCFYRADATHAWYGDNIHSNIRDLGFDASRSCEIYNRTDLKAFATRNAIYGGWLIKYI